MFAFPIVINLLHELFGQQKWRHSKTNQSSPICFIKDGKAQILTIDDIFLGESGRIVETFICNGNYEIMHFLSHPTGDVSQLFNSKLFIQGDFSLLIKEVQKMISNNIQNNMYITHFGSIIFQNKNEYNNKRIISSTDNNSELKVIKKGRHVRPFNSCVD